MESDHHKDPQLPAHHVRISLVNDDRSAYLKDLSGVVVVIHTEASREHYHIYWQHDKPITRKTFVKHLKQINVFSGLNGQKDFMVSDPKSLDGFWKYTMSGRKDGKFNVFDGFAKGGARCLYWNLTTPRISEFPPRNEVIATPNDVPTGTVTVKKVNKNSSEYKKAQWVSFCREYYAEFPEKELSREKLTRLLFYQSEGSFNEFAAPQYVNHAFYKLLHEAGEGKRDEFKSFRDAWCAKIISRL